MVDKLFSGIGNIATQWILSLAGDRPGVQNILFAHLERPLKFDAFARNVVRCKMANKKYSHCTKTREFLGPQGPQVLPSVGPSVPCALKILMNREKNH